LTGTDRQFGFKREFLEPDKKEWVSGGIRMTWELHEPGIYEYCHQGRHATVRGFGRLDENGWTELKKNKVLRYLLEEAKEGDDE
jgi:hypothetical protein